jgi:hypothetical protein
VANCVGSGVGSLRVALCFFLLPLLLLSNGCLRAGTRAIVVRLVFFWARLEF